MIGQRGPPDLSATSPRRARQPRYPGKPGQAAALRERAHLLHEPAHLAELLDEVVDVRDRRSRAGRDPAPPRAVDERWIHAFGPRHRRDDRLDPLELALGLGTFRELLREGTEPR